MRVCMPVCACACVCVHVCVTVGSDARWIGAAVGAHVPPRRSANSSSSKPLLAAPSDVNVTLMRVLFVAKVGGSSCARKLHAAAPTDSPLAATVASPVAVPRQPW